MVRFGSFEFDPVSGRLRRTDGAGRPVDVRLEPQPAKALAQLLAAPGAVVSREQLKAALWGDDTHVDFDRGLAYAINQVRSALGDTAENPRFIETLPRRGYRFIAPVHAAPEGAVSAPVEPAATALPSRRWVFILALCVAIGTGVVGWWWVTPGRPVLAIAVFDNETGRTELDRFTAGLSDAVIAQLGRLDTARIGLIGNARQLRMPRSYRDLGEIQDATGATFILLAQLQNTDTGLRLIAHLIRLSDGRHVWVRRINWPASIESLSDLEQQLLTDVEHGVREHLLGERPSS